MSDQRDYQKMINRSAFLTIKPEYEGSRCSEEFYKDYDRFKKDFMEFFQNFPDEVIIQWPYEHFDDFSSVFRWDIEYERLKFQKGYLPIENYTERELLLRYRSLSDSSREKLISTVREMTAEYHVD